MAEQTEDEPKRTHWLWVNRDWLLLIPEAIVTLCVLVWVLWGVSRYCTANHRSWDLESLLTLLHERWKGALLIAAVLFNRTVRELLHRLRKLGPAEFDPVPKAKPTAPAALPTERQLPAEGPSNA